MVGVHLSPATTWSQLIGAAPDEETAAGSIHWDGEPSRGSLPAAQAQLLGEILAGGRSPAQPCRFGVWQGWADLDGRWRSAPTVELADLHFFVLTGEVRDAAASLGTDPVVHRSASLWWPDDRSWIVATGIDARSTYVSGPRESIAAVLAEPGLEAFPV